MERLRPDGVHVPRTERAGRDQVDRPAEGGLQFFRERDEVKSDRGVDVDEDVDVAAVRLVAARKRAEQGEVAHSEPSTEVGLHRPESREDFIPGSNHEGSSLSEGREGYAGRPRSVCDAREPSEGREDRPVHAGASRGGVSRESVERFWSPAAQRGEASLVLSLVLFPSAAAILGYPRIVKGGAACRVPGSTRRA